jgi:hypothetical protein
MRAANLLAFDEYLTSGAAVMYTSDALNAQLGAFDQLALMAVVDDVTPDPNLGSSGFKVQIRHSADGRNWLPKNAFGVTEIGGSTGITLVTGQHAYAGGDAGTPPSLGLVQLRVDLGTARAAHVRVHVTGRNLGSG